MADNLTFEQLEERRLLAVSVTTGKQGLLKITSDGDSDAVAVVGTGVSGQVDVFVNGSFFDTFDGVKTIKATMKGGDDLLELSAIHIGGAVTAEMGEGADFFVIDTLPFFGAEGFGGEGAVFIGGSVIAKLGNDPGDQGAMVTFEAFGGEGFGITVGNNVTIAGGEGTFLQEFFGITGTSAVEDTDINIGGFLKISSNNPDGAEVSIQNVNVGGTAILTLGGGDDDVFVDASSFARRVEVSMGAGDDELVVEDSSFSAEVVANGGKGLADFLDASVGNSTAVTPVVNGFETII
jgi:hypothetical protein